VISKGEWLGTGPWLLVASTINKEFVASKRRTSKEER